ncbi:hypothetical protein C8A00DRAFT_12798 [Chaetomidium leptoderma]|uniref:Uncharacterized protein n=1 Tax=Chaetomidium leptoderma TaxID=669021 RepID=A0AAN6VS26_9PEZI|nr:hypothetical protein C8A00DRAFT_12798 [Chaetomidium leptoderma]
MAGASAVGVLAGRGGPGLDAVGNASMMASPTPDELRDIREYGRLLRFRDEVVGGSHPRIKPAHLPGKPAQSQKSTASTISAVPAAPTQPRAAKRAANNRRPVIDPLLSRQANKQRAQVNMASSVPGLGTLPSVSDSAKLSEPGKPEINPVLLEKSDDLIKAEIQLQRQRLESGLKKQLEQRRTINKASEQLAELDVADIMAKAMSLVHATPPVQITDDAAANVSASNDSDDDTFYSSRHDTPESNMVSRLPNESEDEEMREGSPYEPHLDFEPVAQPQTQPATSPTQAVPSGAPSRPQQQPNPPTPAQAAPTAMVAVPGLHIGARSSTRVYQPEVPEASGAVQSSSGSRSEESGNTGSAQLRGAHDFARVNEQLLDQARAREPPLVRGHDLSPLAPQPTHVLQHPAIAREPQLAPSESSGSLRAAPAQVTALRKQPSNGSSPESSPHGSKAADKKKNKKKKRKADRLATDAVVVSPHIKPEPRSPSPLTPQYARPNKRQRYSQQQPLEIHDDSPRYEQPLPAEEAYPERYQPRVIRQERVVGYERADDYHARQGQDAILVASPRYERVYYDDYRAPPPSAYPAGPESAQYVAREVRTVRPASRVVESPYEDGGAAYYRDVRAASRMSVRPAAFPEHEQSPVGYERPPAAMPPPSAPPRRIIVDAFGREYLEPVRPAPVAREEIVAEPRGPYERLLPPRAISRRTELLDDDAVLYRPASPAGYAAPRRVVTQPEYSYRESAGPSNPMPPPSTEYLPSRPELPREYIPRPSSVRPPPMEPTRYDAPSVYERIQAPIDDRLPPPPQDYYRAASARPAATRYEVPVAYERLRYEAPPPGGYGGPTRRLEYAPAPPPPAGYYHPQQQHHHHQQQQEEVRREAMPPPPQQQQQRAYSVMPSEAAPAQAVRREYAAAAATGAPQPAAGGYYGQSPDDEVVFLERGGYREMR